MKTAHVLFLVDTLYSTLGGAEGVLWKIARLLPSKRYRCSVATLAARPEMVVADAFSCPVHLFPLRRLYGLGALRTAVRLSRLIREQRVSIVHTFFPASDLLGPVAAALAGHPVAVISSRRDMGFKRSALHRIAYRLAAGSYDQVHAVCEQVRAHQIEEDRLDPDKVFTVYNGVDLDAIDAAPSVRFGDLGIGSGSPIVICVANIRRIKALDVLVQTAALVCRELPDVRFLVAGLVHEQDYFKGLLEQARNLNLSRNIHFIGCSDRVPSLLKSSDVFFLPSRSEGMPNALLEAMACALPCVATSVGGNPELVHHGKNGYLVPPEDPSASAQAIAALLRDPSLARQMGAAGRAIVETRFTVRMMMRRITDLYDEALAGQMAPEAVGQSA